MTDTPEVQAEEFPQTAIEKEMDSPLRKPFSTHNNKRNQVNMLSAAEERIRRRRHPNSKAKKYDGRGGSWKNTTKTKRSIAKHKAKLMPGKVALPRVRDALNTFYKEVKQEDLMQALEVTNDPRYNMLLSAIQNPRMHNCSFAELCRKCRMSIQDVVNVWRNHIQARGIVKMMSHMPEVMEDVAVDSKSRMVPCYMCQGQGRMAGQKVNGVAEPTCPECNGEGTVRLKGDKDARELVFEAAGLKKSAGGVNIMNVNQQGGVPSMEDQIADVDKVFDAEYTELGGSNGGNGVIEVTKESKEVGKEGKTIGGTPLPQAEMPTSYGRPSNGADDSGFNDPLPPKSDPTDYH